jgi:predicted RNase H-like HicB family nuclease
MTLRYRINIWWSEEDEAFLARIPDLPYTISHGSTPQVAVEAVMEAGAIWIKIAKEKGWAIPEPSPLPEMKKAAA